jgi:hypothetical protein
MDTSHLGAKLPYITGAPEAGSRKLLHCPTIKSPYDFIQYRTESDALHVTGNVNAVRFPDRLAEDEVESSVSLSGNSCSFRPFRDVQAIQLLRGVDPGRLEGLDLEQHPE